MIRTAPGLPEGPRPSVESRCRRSRSRVTPIAAATALLGLLVWGSLSTGSVDIGSEALLRSLLSLVGAGPGTPADGVLLYVRMPRTALGILVGAALATSGVMLQGLLRNPLADPALIGVSSGAALGAAVAIVLIGDTAADLGIWLTPTLAIVAALATTALVYRIGAGSGVSTERLILAGVAFNALAAAGIGLLLDLADDDQLRSLTAWTLGGMGGTTWPAVGVCAIAIAAAMPVALRSAADLNTLLLGPREAHYLGTDVARLTRRVVALSAIMVGVVTCFVGIVGFVGLVVPHIVRRMVGADHQRLLPLSAIVGAALLVVADLGCRTVVAPRELPLGVLTSLVGGPFFLWLIARMRGAQA